MTFDHATIAPLLAELAAKGVFIGTPSWKYPGWHGMLYDEQRYIYRGKVAESALRTTALANTPRCSRPSAWMPRFIASRR